MKMAEVHEHMKRVDEWLGIKSTSSLYKMYGRTDAGHHKWRFGLTLAILRLL